MSGLLRMAWCLVFLLCSSTAHAAELVYPPDANILNVRDFGAIPNDGLEDTAAIQAAIEFAATAYNRYASAPYIYLPAGRYDISRPLESRIADRTTWNGWRSGMHLVGQNRGTTILRLTDNNPLYQSRAAPLAVIKTGSEMVGFPSNAEGAGNEAFNHFVRNLTIDTGRGNPGAIGIDYLANNLGAIEDVSIVSSDAARVGVAGISMLRYGPGPAIIQRVSVNGFEYAIDISRFEYAMTLEHVTIANQKVAGIRNAQNTLAIRDLRSTNTVPAVSNQGSVYLIDSALSSPIVNTGALFVRDATTEATSSAPEFVFDSPPRSLRLPIKETPDFYTPDFTRWANVEAFGATKNLGTDDDAPGIQAAIDSGREIVYLPAGEYRVGSPIVLRGNVRKLLGFRSFIGPRSGATLNPLVRFAGGTQNHVILEQLRIEGPIEHASTKGLVLRHTRNTGGVRSTPAGTGELFIEDATVDLDVRSTQRVWARQLNLEGDGPEAALLRNDGGTIWALGIKTESEHTVLENLSGTVEILGGLVFPIRAVPATVPMLVNRGRLSASVTQSGNRYPVMVRETRAGVVREMLREEWNSRAFPLYTGDPSAPPSLVAAYTFDRNLLASVDGNTGSVASDLVVGPGLSAGVSRTAQRFVVEEFDLTNTAAAGLAAGDTLTFAVSPVAGQRLSVSSLVLDGFRNNPFTDRIRVSSSVDGFAASFEFPLTKVPSTATWQLAGNPAYQGLTSTVTFRLVLYGDKAQPTPCACRVLLDSVAVYGTTLP